MSACATGCGKSAILREDDETPVCLDCYIDRNFIDLIVDARPITDDYGRVLSVSLLLVRRSCPINGSLLYRRNVV